MIGDSARAPSADELTDMKTRIDTAMRAGALGISTALIYPPGAYQSTEELIELAKAAAPYGAIYATHMRDEGVRLGDAISEAIEIGEKGGVKVEIFHLKAAYKPMWGALMEEAGALIDANRAKTLKDRLAAFSGLQPKDFLPVPPALTPPPCAWPVPRAARSRGCAAGTR